jgi:hypothetical protein
MVNFFGGKSEATLSCALRHVTFTKEVATAEAFVTAKRLPPVLPAKGFHSQRDQVWIGTASEMDPTKWGRKQASGSKTLVSLLFRPKSGPGIIKLSLLTFETKI